MKPEKQQLIHELLEGGSRDEHILLAASRILRRRRQGRAARQVLALATLLALAFWLVEQKQPQPTPTRFPSLEAKQPASPLPRSLTDEELLALFPDTPVGLATLPSGRKLLLFPRPADEARYVIRL
jgi:hypothetical protein